MPDYTIDDLATVSSADLIAISRQAVASGSSFPSILPALHVAANQVRAAGRLGEARLLFNEILDHDGGDANVRLALAELACDDDPAAAIDVLRPVLDRFREGYLPARGLRLLADAALRLNEFELLSRFSADLLVLDPENALLPRPTSDERMLALHHRANTARQVAQYDGARALFREILRHSPDDGNVRLALAELAAPGEYHLRYSLLKPVLDKFLSTELPRHGLQMFVTAALEMGDLKILPAALDGLQKLDTSDTVSAAVHDRIGHLERLGLLGVAGESEPARTLAKGLSALSEQGMLDAVRNATSQMIGDDDDAAIQFVLGIAAVSAKEGWSRPYAEGIRFLDRHASAAHADHVTSFWLRAGLPIEAIEPIRLQIGRADRSDGEAPALRAAAGSRSSALADLAQAFAAAPLLAHARAVWERAYQDRHFDAVSRYTPTAAAGVPDGPAALTLAAASRRQVPTPEDGPVAAIWYVITWHEGVERLLRMASLLTAPNSKVVVSIGGSGVPREIVNVTKLLALDNVNLAFRPATTWGGPRLLYHNVFAVFDAFLREPDAAWMQILCNRSFPLMGPMESGRHLAKANILARYPGGLAPPAWVNEWSAETVEEIDEVYTGAVASVFENADMSSFRALAGLDQRLNPSVFNFSDQPEILEKDFKDNSHGYAVSPFGTDMRWMSFARLGEFVDVSTETGKTFTRPLHPLVANWAARVIRKNGLHTGDPFVLISRQFIEVATTDERAAELFAAMNLGFAPEMNFFDTLQLAPDLGLEHQMSHVFYRNDELVAQSSDLQPASLATNLHKQMFTRKTTSGRSAEFIREFSARIAEEWPVLDTFLVVPVAEPAHTPNSPIPDIKILLEVWLIGQTARVRTLLDQELFSVRFEPEGNLSSEGAICGHWHWDAQDLVVDFVVGSLGRKIFRRGSSDGHRLILAPAELVSVRNAWSTFLEFELSTLGAVPNFLDRAILPVTHYHFDGTLAPWIEARSRAAALLERNIEQEPDDYPIPVERVPGAILEVRRSGDRLLALCLVDGWPVLCRVEEFGWLQGTASLLLKRAASDEMAVWDDAAPADLLPDVRAVNLVGRKALITLGNRTILVFRDDGVIADDNGQVIGAWRVYPGGVWIIGPRQVRVGLSAQFQLRSDGWRLSGWGWSSFQDRVTFSIVPV